MIYNLVLKCLCSHTTFLKAGKGRTGLMVCAFLVYSGMSAEQALELYAHRRTTNNEGVSHITYSTNSYNAAELVT